MTRARIVAALAALVVGAASVPASAAWVPPPGGTPAPAPGPAASAPDIAAIDGVPWVAWVEDRAGGDWIRVARLTDAGWQQVGATPGRLCNVLFPCAPVNRDAGSDARSPRLADLGGGVPGVTWIELDATGTNFPNWEVRASRLGATGVWVNADSQAGPINQNGGYDADFPRLAPAGDSPYLMWRELVPNTGNGHRRLHVSQLIDAKFWQPVSDPSLTTAVGSEKQPGSPDLAVVGGVPHVSWYTPSSLPGAVGIIVARFGPAGWERLPPLAGAVASQHALADVGGSPTLAVIDTSGGGRHLRVVRPSGGGVAGWDQLGGGQPLTAPGDAISGTPALEVIDGTPWAAWVEADGAVRVARLGAGGIWERPADAPAGIRARDGAAVAVALTGVGPLPHVAWQADFPASPDEVHAARLEPEVLTTVATPGAGTARVEATVQGWGLPVTAAVAHGVAGGPLATGSATPIGGVVSSVVRELTGLAPATDHVARVVLSAGGISVNGPLVPFRTPAPPGTVPAGAQGTVTTGAAGATGRRRMACRRVAGITRCRIVVATRLRPAARVRATLRGGRVVLARSPLLTVGRRGRLVVVVRTARRVLPVTARLSVRRSGATRAVLTVPVELTGAGRRAA